MKTVPSNLLAFTLCLSAGLVQAGTNGFVVPLFRGTPHTQAGYWESFSIPVGAPGNPPDRPGATTAATLTQSETNAILTGSGNLYNPSGASVFTLADSAPFVLGTVIVQTRTLGSELDYASAMLSCTNQSGAVALAPTAAAELDRGSQPGLGATVSHLWQWDLTGLGVTAYAVTFRASGESLSFDSLTLDVADRFQPLFTAPFALRHAAPSLERWMYPHNAAPCDRPAGSVFGSFAEDAAVDTRHGQQLLGWETGDAIPAGHAPARYLVSRCRVTLTLNRGDLFVYDPTHDRCETHFPTNQAGHLPDDDAGWPVELFGAGFRNGFDATTFSQCSAFGGSTPGARNAYAAGWSATGKLVDVSNNVGKSAPAFPPFEAVPFAVAQVPDVTPGQLVPAGAKLVFELNLHDPFVLAYVQNGLSQGRLRFVVSSLHANGGPAGPASYPDFATHFNEAVVEPTSLELEGLVVGSGDVDTDGLPDDWERNLLGTLTYSGADDPDGDGAPNLAEWRAGTDPRAGSSVFRLALSGASSGDGFTLRFPHTASRRCTIEYADNLTDWRIVTNAPLFYLEATSVQWVDDGSRTGGLSPNRSYRVRADQP